MSDIHFEAKDCSGDEFQVVNDGVGPMLILQGNVMQGGVRFIPKVSDIPSICRAIYTAANLEWPTAPDLGPLREALLDLRARWDANGTTVEEITYLLKVAEDMEIIPPVKPDPLKEMRTALLAMANDESLTIIERRKAAVALDALS